MPDYETEVVSGEEQEHYLTALLTSQLTLARTVCAHSPFATVLHKRLVVLQRIFYAVANKYHDREKIRQQQQQQKDEAAATGHDNKPNLDKSPSGTDALIEMAVKTGLSLIFSLLRQNWCMPPQVGGVALCNDVLSTALDVVRSLPSLSLANENKLPSLGLASLSQVTNFLKSVSMPNSGANIPGKRIASELVLALAAQRGSLR